MKTFDNNIKIGDRFTSPSGKITSEVIDILKLFSISENKFTDKLIYIAKGLNGLAIGPYEVSKTTIVRYRCNEVLISN